MSYDLAFWAGPRSSREPASIYQDLMDGHAVDSLGTFATAPVLAALEAKFPGLSAPLEAGQAFWESNPAGVMFEFFWSEQHLVAMARGQFTNDQMNAVIDVCVSVGGGRLYDPQTDERFDSQ